MPLLGIWVLTLLGTASPHAAPYADGAPPGFSGGFKEQACDACHFEHDINARPGQLTVTGVPERFAPGERFTLTVTLARPEMRLGGFQLTSRAENGGAQAGALAAAPGEEKRVAVDIANGIQYARQRREGAGPAPLGILRWEVLWTAPAMPGPVLFHAAANAGNNDEFAGGDYVYTSVARSQGTSSAQSQPAPAFEVATIRQHEAGVRIPSSMTVTPARVDIVGYQLRSLILEAFKVPLYQLAYPD